MAPEVTRVFTRISGLPVCPEPEKGLFKYCNKVRRYLEKLPKESAYRIQTEEFIKERKHIVETIPNPEEIEKKIGAGLCEELIEQAKQEIHLINVMKEHKPWEPMEEKPAPNQWKWPL